jgi:2-hydroxy-6-oxonona-2,4-dienedioate hydrolase
MRALPAAAYRRGMILRRGGIALAGLTVLVLLVIVLAALTDRPTAEPLTVDRDAPEVVAYLEAERAFMAHHDLDYTDHDVEIEDPGLRVRVLEVGDGPPVIVVPPAAGEAARLAPLLAELDGYRYLLVNLPGGGASDGIDLRAVDHRRMAIDTLDAVHDHFGLDATPIVASSIGGTWALWYGLDRPDRVIATVQLGVPVAVEGTTVPATLGMLGVPGLNRFVTSVLMPSAGPAEAADGFGQVFGHPTRSVEAMSGPALEFEYALQQLPTYGLSWRALGQDTVRFGGVGGWEPDVEVGLDDLARFQHPTLLVWPSNDPFGDPDAGHQVAAHLPEAELHVAGIGHLPWLDDPAVVAELIDMFFDVTDQEE